MAAPPLLLLQDIRLTISGKPLIEGAELSVAPGERLALVGRNGSGKSTLLRIAAGELEADGGTRFFQPGASVRYLQQEPDLSAFDTVLAYAEAGLGPTDDHYKARYLLNELGLSGDENPANLSGGEARRAALARVIAAEPDILLLDEPTNHLDLPAIEWLEKVLRASRSALVLISHDRRFLENLSRTTVWLDRGRTRRLEKGFGSFEAWRDEVLEQEELELHKLDRRIVNEEHWVRHGVSARRKRNMRRMGRLQDLRSERRDARKVTGTVKMEVSQAQLSGKLVVEAEQVSKSYGERAIVRDFSTRIMRGDRLGVVGANGAGKTTLIKMLIGELAPDEGKVTLGANLEIASLDQRRVMLLPDWTVKDALTGGGGDWVDVNGQRKHFAGYMKDFLFQPEQARTPVTKLSGGERARLMLARALSLPSNLMVLDEPTNDLDLETLDLLEELIADYPGTVIVVSHDRDFLDRVATSVVVSEGDGRWIEYAGGYTDMLSQRGFGVGGEPLAREVKTKSAPAVSSQSSGAKKRLSFKQKHALETLPKRMEELQAQQATRQKELDDASLYARDPKRFAELSQAFAKAADKLVKAEEEWLELEMLREEIEG
ncbi:MULTISPECIES: ATP-binding cassette domain-containing protein [unclassified Beijerinckia]|uniref:ABC-F family ATP-binding cassette domain-containing protein n=1 Tax=unclassified Beijerinckia TaxID=2638183 RepID=UPI00089BB41D|nr:MULTISPECIES: ATP-binding cassette domain-containing protein [unclassified Beijerinckia]MDH7796752.1 ATP-binding cassette subfamily F protein uup [Beijerinckia sp. GAS462]SEC58431.1 ATP-binding cassette, subfamily F, uup [Beijerinckia sp. 28-YEA-48]